ARCIQLSLTAQKLLPASLSCAASDIPASVLLLSRHAMMTRARRLAISKAVSLPMPVFVPVMMTVLPIMLSVP
ncbi:hypothetical protein Hamer_G018252, partial [Homarus americanus]